MIQALEVYQLENIIPSADMVALEDSARSVLSGEKDFLLPTDDASQFSVFFTDEFTRLGRNNQDEETKLRLLKALIYTEGLIKFSVIKKKILNRGAMDESLSPVVPQSVKTSIKEQFASKSESQWYVIFLRFDTSLVSSLFDL